MAGAVNKMPQLPGQGFMLWHSVALVPKEVNISEIKRASDVAKRGGKIVTEPQVGAYGNVQVIVPVISSTPNASPEQKKP
jgi:hypothetical protein